MLFQRQINILCLEGCVGILSVIYITTTTVVQETGIKVVIHPNQRDKEKSDFCKFIEIYNISTDAVFLYKHKA